MDERAPLSPHFREYVLGIVALHHLSLVGRDESDEADAIRDRLDAPWGCLSMAERDQIGGLSADLFALSEPPGEPGGEPEWAAFDSLTITGDWPAALEWLRANALGIPADALRERRAELWRLAGLREAAEAFAPGVPETAA